MCDYEKDLRSEKLSLHIYKIWTHISAPFHGVLLRFKLGIKYETLKIVKYIYIYIQVKEHCCSRYMFLPVHETSHFYMNS